MLFGEYEIVQEFFSFLCKSCYASFSFAHRIIWFLKASIGANPEANEKIRNFLHIIQTIFKSEKDKDSIESFYLSGSSDYIYFLKKQNILHLYFNKTANSTKGEKISDNIKDFINSRIAFRNILDNWVEMQYDRELEREGLKNIHLISEENIKEIEDNDNKKENLSSNNINPEEIYLSLFQKYDYVTNDENNIHMQYVKQIDSDDLNLSSFLSNINFIDHLCNICDVLLNTSNTDRKKTLLNEIKKINKILPSNVYVPFVNNSIRNFVIASIPISEIKIFKTKQRCPYMITIECFRLDELNYYFHKDQTQTQISQDVLNDKYQTISDSKSEKRNEGISHKHKIRTMSDFDINPNDKIKKKSKNNLSLLYNKITNKSKEDRDELTETKDKIKNYSNKPESKMFYLIENEVKFSKPIIISDQIRRKQEENQIEEIKLDENIKYKKHNNTKKKGEIEYRHLGGNENDISINQNESGLSVNEGGNIILTLNNAIEHSKFDQIDKEIKAGFLSQREEKKQINDKSQNESNASVSSSPFQKENSSSDPDSSKSEGEQNTTISNNVDQNNEQNSHSIFGETASQQTERLRKLSPFGNLSSYTIFNVIIKSGEDLRQEQFATQLINEFYQIFKFEKVKCWLMPYEIIATGTNAGIVEGVPNSISIDQLKRKFNSLSDFFTNYFGPINSILYAKAMKNFVQSLAGYSLVCYFLQVKDRHNANILIDDQGHLIHIDFGFMLSNAPGKGLKFERAPFKLTNEFVEVMGGTKSKYFSNFRKLLWKGFIALAEHYEKILILVEMMYCGHGNNLPCFEAGQNTINELRQRFVPRPKMKKRDYIEHVDNLISQSLDNWRTNWYDRVQYYMQGIMA